MALSRSAAYPKSMAKLSQLLKPTLVELCESLRLPTDGFKGDLVSRVWIHLDQHIVKAGVTDDFLANQIQKLLKVSRMANYQRTARNRTVHYPRFMDHFPMYDECMEAIIHAQSLDIGPNSVQVVEFVITPDQMDELFLLESSFNVDIALMFWYVGVNEIWEPLDIGVTFNERHIHPHRPGDHIFFLYQYARLGVEDIKNELVIAGDNQKLKDWAFRVRFCKIRSIDAGIAYFNRDFEVGTHRSYSLTQEAFTKYPTLKFELNFLDPVGNGAEYVEHPCRSTRCKHLRVFDLKKLLEEYRNKFQYTCPICDVDFFFWETEPDLFCRENTENGVRGFDCYNIKPPVKVNNDPDCVVVMDVITLD